MSLINYPDSVKESDVLLFFSLFTPDGSFDPDRIPD